MILSSAPLWYFLQYINATHFIALLAPSTIAHHPPYPRWYVIHGTHAGTSHQHSTHGTHSSNPTTLPHQHTTRESMPPTSPTQPGYQCHPRQHEQHAISQAHLNLFFLQDIFRVKESKKLLPNKLKISFEILRTNGVRFAV